MDFRTVISIPPSEYKLTPEHKILMIGSCFTDNVGAKFREAMWRVAVNPCGVQYNPAAICRLLGRCLDGDMIAEGELMEREGVYHHWLFDSHFSSTDKDEALHKMNDALSLTREYLASAQVTILTLGTSWIYRLAESGVVVSNCHKYPSATFRRERLSVDDIVVAISNLIERIRDVNPTHKMMFTVSPIRHFKDGAHQNTLSKATLQLAVARLAEIYPKEVLYFPAYEIMLDELRDYRFYASDMVHVSQVAIDYIWQRFRACYFTEQTDRIVDEAVKLSLRLGHRHITTDMVKIAQFESQTQSMLSDFLARHPYLQR